MPSLDALIDGQRPLFHRLLGTPVNTSVFYGLPPSAQCAHEIHLREQARLARHVSFPLFGLTTLLALFFRPIPVIPSMLFASLGLTVDVCFWLKAAGSDREVLDWFLVWKAIHYTTDPEVGSLPGRAPVLAAYDEAEKAELDTLRRARGRGEGGVHDRSVFTALFNSDPNPIPLRDPASTVTQTQGPGGSWKVTGPDLPIRGDLAFTREDVPEGHAARVRDTASAVRAGLAGFATTSVFGDSKGFFGAGKAAAHLDEEGHLKPKGGLVTRL